MLFDELMTYIKEKNIHDIRDISNICVTSSSICKDNEQIINQTLLTNLGFVVDEKSLIELNTKLTFVDVYNYLYNLYNEAYKNNKTSFMIYLSSDNLLNDVLVNSDRNRMLMMKFILKYRSNIELYNILINVCKFYNKQYNSESSELIEFIIELIPSTYNVNDILNIFIQNCVDLCEDEKCNTHYIISNLVKKYNIDIKVPIERALQTDNIHVYKKIYTSILTQEQKNTYIYEHVTHGIQYKAYKILDFIETYIKINKLTSYIETFLVDTIKNDDEKTYKFIIDFICHKKLTEHFEKYFINMSYIIIDNAQKIKKLMKSR